MDMPDGWEKLSYLKEGWGKGRCTVMRTSSDWGYSWYETPYGGGTAGSPTPCPAPSPANLLLEGVPMGMPDGWVVVPYLKEGWRKGARVVERPRWDLPEYVWYEYSVSGEHGGFPDPVSCAVACELATGGCTDGHS